MADVQISTKDLLQCPVCLDRFERPRSLPCLHTFCTLCLHAHITSVSQASLRSVFLCPVCRAQTKPPRPYTSRDTWADQFPVNHWILSVLEEAALKEKDESLVCDQHSEYKICLFCVDHESVCCPKCVALSHRKCDNVVDIEYVVQRWDINKDLHDVSQQLAQFENQMIELRERNLFESDSLFADKQDIRHIVKQTKDKLIAHIEMLERNFLEELDAKCVTLEDDIEQSRKIWTHGKELCAETNKSLENIEMDSPLKSFFKLNAIKHKLADAINASARTSCSNTNTPTFHFKMNETFSQIGNICSVGEIQVRTTNTEQCIDIAEFASGNMLTDRLECSPNSRTGSPAIIDVTPSIADTNVTADDIGPNVSHQAGSVVDHDTMPETHDVQRVVPREAYTTSSASNGTRGSWITSAVYFKNKITILCDGRSHSLKLFRDRKVMYEDNRRTSPWCAARICDTFLAVTYPRENLVRVFEVRCKAAALKLFGTPTFFGSPVRLYREIPTEKDCYGVCYSGELLYVACERCLNVYTLDGRLQQSFENNNEHGPFLRVIDTVIDKAKPICYTIDEARDTVYAFKLDSRHLIRDSSPYFVYKRDSLRGPQGMAIGPGGELYVTGFVSKTVHVVTSAGETSRVLSVPEQPWAVLIDARHRSMILSFYTHQNVRENIHVYSLSE